MTVSYALHDIKFEWDSRKASGNLKKHGLSFETACEAFFDPFLVVVETRSVGGEFREAIIGMTVNWRLLHVAYVLREEVMRIVSARAATNPERKSYEDQ